jgi:hypothetical protein
VVTAAVAAASSAAAAAADDAASDWDWDRGGDDAWRPRRFAAPPPRYGDGEEDEGAHISDSDSGGSGGGSGSDSDSDLMIVEEVTAKDAANARRRQGSGAARPVDPVAAAARALGLRLKGEQGHGRASLAGNARQII